MASEDTARRLLRVGLVAVAIIQLSAWLLRPLLNDVMPHQSPGRFEIITGMVFTVPYLLAFACTFWPKRGNIVAAAGAAMGFAAVNLPITLFPTPGLGIRKLVLGGAEVALFVIGLWVAGQSTDKRRIVLWAMRAFAFLLVWYMGALTLLASQLKNCH